MPQSSSFVCGFFLKLYSLAVELQMLFYRGRAHMIEHTELITLTICVQQNNYTLHTAHTQNTESQAKPKMCNSINIK